MLETTTLAMMKCAGGGSDLMFDGLPEINILVQALPAGNTAHIMTDVNLIPLGQCEILSEAAGGFPVPCVPIAGSEWMMGMLNVTFNGMPALDNFSFLACSNGGMISIVFPNNESVFLGL